MKVGDQVLYYTHEANDLDHWTRDTFAIVLAEVNDDTVDIVAFPVGGPTFYGRVSAFNPERDLHPGLSYYRPLGDKPPDFEEAFLFYGNPEWQALLVRQRDELARAAPKDVEALKVKHITQREKLYTDLDKKSSPPAEAHVRQPIDPTRNPPPQSNPSGPLGPSNPAKAPAPMERKL